MSGLKYTPEDRRDVVEEVFPELSPELQEKIDEIVREMLNRHYFNGGIGMKGGRELVLKLLRFQFLKEVKPL